MSKDLLFMDTTHNFMIGVYVIHPIYGRGTIVGIRQDYPDYPLIIEFEDTVMKSSFKYYSLLGKQTKDDPKTLQIDHKRMTSVFTVYNIVLWIIVLMMGCILILN